MRFSANQLRVLQESLSSPVPPMSAPPELSLAHQPPKGITQQHSQQTQEGSRIPCWVLAPSYFVSGAFAVVVAVAWPSSLPPSAVLGGTSLLPAALVFHALCTPQSRAAQILAGCCSVFLPCAFATGQPYALLGSAVLLSLFFCAALVSSPCHPVLKLLVPAFSLLVASCGAIACFAQDSPQLRRGAWTLACGALCAQGAAASAKLRTFELLCGLKPI